MKIIKTIQFPEFTGINCKMMPFIQGNSNSLPEQYKSYSDIIEENYLEKGEVGYLTIDESFVKANSSQRGYNCTGSNRNVHIEVGKINNINCWGGGGSGWGGRRTTILEDTTEVLIANSLNNTCRVWNAIEKAYTKDGDLSEYLDKYSEETGVLLKSGELAKMSIFTPHECVIQTISAPRQFFRIVGKGVHEREDYFTINPLLN